MKFHAVFDSLEVFLKVHSLLCNEFAVDAVISNRNPNEFHIDVTFTYISSDTAH
ncbi:MAG: hypothetical protein IJY50_08050 [Clostridia bacterium]|nr:hypothetical protein [Clostridia bacterium]